MNLDKSNSRKHSDRNKAAIRRSLETAKAARSIVIDSGDNVLAGNGVAEQAEALGIPVQIVESDGTRLIAVKRVDVAPDSPEARHIATMDNLVADTSAFDYDAERLRAALANDPVSKAIAEQDERLRKLLKVTKPESVDAGELVDKAAQLQEKWQVKGGDLWQCGKHRILCGDSTNAEDVARLMQGEKAGMVFTDPPFGNKLGYGRGQLGERYIENDDSVAVLNALPHVVDTVLADNSHCLIWIQWRTFAELKALFANYSLRTVVVWDKEQAGLSGGGFAEQHEWICVFIRGKATQNDYSGNVWRANRENHFGGRVIHPTMKPVELIDKGIRLCSKVGDIVWDGFVGAGSLLIAAEQTGRIGRGVEISEKYVAVSLERLANLGLECVRVSQS